MTVVAIRKAATAASGKAVEANQKAIDALLFDSGTWRVEGAPGLYLRCRARTKSFFLQRRVDGELVKLTLGALSLKDARGAAMREWSKLKPTPARRDSVTLGAAIDEYLEQQPLSPKTREGYRYNADNHLGKSWLARTLREVGEDRFGVRRLQGALAKKHGEASSNQTMRLLSAVYRWARQVDVNLPEPPTTATKLYRIKPRDWALDPAGLKAWAAAVAKLSTIKRAWWWACLLTGARRGSIEAMRWTDVDFKNKMIRFETAKGGRAYSIPAADELVKLLAVYRDSGKVAPSEWVFPSPRDGRHIIKVKDKGVASAHHLRHTFRTTLSQLGATGEQARLLLGHVMAGVSEGYVTSSLVVESLRPLANAVAEKYLKIISEKVK
jgi:integrase